MAGSNLALGSNLVTPSTPTGAWLLGETPETGTQVNEVPTVFFGAQIKRHGKQGTPGD